MGTPVDLLLSSKKCQGVPFSAICQHIITFRSGPISVDPPHLSATNRLAPQVTKAKTNFLAGLGPSGLDDDAVRKAKTSPFGRSAQMRSHPSSRTAVAVWKRWGVSR